MPLLPLMPPLFVMPGTQAYWWLSFATALDEDGDITSSEDLCKSNQAATSHPPADVTSWGCEYFAWLPCVSYCSLWLAVLDTVVAYPHVT